MFGRSAASDPGSGARGDRCLSAALQPAAPRVLARSCGNQPPAVAFPELAALPAVPAWVDPDAWLQDMDGQAMVRRVDGHGKITIDCHAYFVGQRFAHQQVSASVSAATGQFLIFSQAALLKTCPIQGLQGRWLPFEKYVSLMEDQALAEARHWQAQSRPSAHVG